MRHTGKRPHSLNVIPTGSLAPSVQDFRALRKNDKNRPLALCNPYLVAKEMKKRGKRLKINGVN